MISRRSRMNTDRHHLSPQRHPSFFKYVRTVTGFWFFFFPSWFSFFVLFKTEHMKQTSWVEATAVFFLIVIFCIPLLTVQCFSWPRGELLGKVSGNNLHQRNKLRPSQKFLRDCVCVCVCGCVSAETQFKSYSRRDETLKFRRVTVYLPVQSVNFPTSLLLILVFYFILHIKNNNHNTAISKALKGLVVALI